MSVKLCVNTANSNLFLCLSKDGQVFKKQLEKNLKHNEYLLPCLDELLNEACLKVSDVDEFGVVVGPGSFTGIRVGVSTVKALRDALNKSAKGINNLDYLFKLASKQNSDVKVVAIAGSRNSYFVARFIEGQIYKYDRNLTTEELIALAENSPIGMFEEDENLNCFVVETDAETMLECLDESVDENLLPVYYQLSQAENEKLKKFNLNLKEMTKEDIAEVCQIESETALSDKLSYEEIEKIIDNPNYKKFVIENDNEILAFMILQITDEVNVFNIVTKSGFRNLGLATKLLSKAEEIAKVLGLIL